MIKQVWIATLFLSCLSSQAAYATQLETEPSDVHQHSGPSAQTNHHSHGRGSAPKTVKEHGRRYRIVNRAIRSETYSLVRHHDLLADPEFVAQVAARNGLTPMRFYSQEMSVMMQQVEDFLAEKEMVAKATTLNRQPLDGRGHGRPRHHGTNNHK